MSIESLRSAVSKLTFQMELLKRLVDSERDPFVYLVFENGLSREQHQNILEYMD